MATTTINVNASFTGLSDTPSSYTGQAGKAVFVNGTATGLEFGTAGGGDNLFTANLTLVANRTHDMNGNSLTFLKSKVEFRASDGLSANKTFWTRNHTNTADTFAVLNSGDVIANGGSGNVNITSIGSASGKSGNVLTAFGAGAGMSSLSGTENAFFGYNAGQNCSAGSYNLFAGANAGGQNNASDNVFLGSSAGANNTGGRNVIIGSGLAGWLGTGSSNTITGTGACQGLSSGSNNSSYGNLALANVGTGSGNVGIGDYAGTLRGAGFSDTNLNPSESIFIGAYSKAQNSNQSNQIVIGLNAVGEGSNTARIGNSSVTELHIGGNGASLALKSPNGTTWRISVDNSGNLVIV
jgi:hypothetical protein